ncbi:hypothetical protein BD289DRAFT_488118 [Coniella lustricola]|uniref:Rhodopsin domain-containing protein n=1 Tax=Coniella lustricola TaxID=2025994 RepID=A0A2T3A468_9PEZI|nr:hypothetical protein BD289DRAFT_488118 [Coniella lustricola]
MSGWSKNGMLAASGSLLGLATISVGLRLWARKKKQHAAFLADDALAIVAWLAVARSVFELLCLACIKLSAVFFYRRIFTSTYSVTGKKQWFNVISTVTIVVIILWLITFEFLAGFECGTDIASLWNGNYLKNCTITFPFLYGEAVSDFLLDVWILALPIPSVLQLHTSVRRKLEIGGMFLLGYIGLGASIARMVEYIVVENGGALLYLYGDTDVDDSKAVFYGILEIGISLVAINLPSCWLLLTQVAPDKVIRSIRSVISLGSLRSGRGDGNNTNETSKKAGSAASSRPSDASLRLRSDVEAQNTHTSAERGTSDLNVESLPGGVHVQSAVSISHN